jgi:hypothetical protein
MHVQYQNSAYLAYSSSGSSTSRSCNCDTPWWRRPSGGGLVARSPWLPDHVLVAMVSGVTVDVLLAI